MSDCGCGDSGACDTTTDCAASSEPADCTASSAPADCSGTSEPAYDSSHAADSHSHVHNPISDNNETDPQVFNNFMLSGITHGTDTGSNGPLYDSNHSYTAGHRRTRKAKYLSREDPATRAHSRKILLWVFALLMIITVMVFIVTILNFIMTQMGH